MPRSMTRWAAVIAAMCVGAGGSAAWGQAGVRAAFVANSGNLEGSVSAFTIDDDGVASLVNRIVTGSRGSLSEPCSGCNAYSIDLSPSGKYLATGHAPNDDPLPKGITIFRVSGDASITQILHIEVLNTNSSPLSIRWLSDDHLAVTRSSISSSSNGVAVYAFNPDVPSLTLIDTEGFAGFTTNLIVHPTEPILYAQSTLGTNAVIAYDINPNGTLTYINFFPSPNYPFGMDITSDGARLYAAAGGSGSVVNGWSINKATGALTLMTGSPFAVTGASPKQIAFSDDDRFAFTGHGSGGYLRNFKVEEDGSLTFLGFAMSMGTTGSIGEIAVLDELVLACDRDTISDGVRGLRVFAIGEDGSLTATGPAVDTLGINPNSVVGWKRPALTCLPDISGDGSVGVPDLLAVINSWGDCDAPCPPHCAADINEDCSVGVPDLLAVINAWGTCPK